MPVSWVTSGTCFGANQCGTSRSTEMNVTASPRPTTARAAIAGGQRLGERQRQLAGRHQCRAGNDQRLGAEPVEQQARGHLGARVDDDLQDDERRQHAGAGGEPVGGLEPRDAERGAVEDGDDVGEESGRPDDPGTHAEPHRLVLMSAPCSRSGQSIANHDREITHPAREFGATGLAESQCVYSMRHMAR